MTTNVRRNPVSTLFRTVQNTADQVSKTVQKTATTVARNAKKTATTVSKNTQRAAQTVSKNVKQTANQVSTQVSAKTKAAVNAANDGLKQVRAETKKATVDSGWNNWASKFEAKDGKLEAGVSKGFGSKMDEAPTMKDYKSKGWVDAPEAKSFKDKAKGAGTEALNSAGVKVFDPEHAKFEKDFDTVVKTKRVDSKTVDTKGYDVGYRALSAYADGKGNITIGKTTNIEGKIEAGAVLGQATIEGKAKLGKTGLEATGKAEATVGVTGSANGSVRVDIFSKKPTVKVKAGVEAFAGAKASVEGRVGNDYAGVGGKAEAWAGIGAKAKADVGIEGGKFKAKVELGAALGIGGSLSFSVDVNYQKAIDTVVGTGQKAVDNIKAAGSAVVNAGGKALDAAGSAISSGWSTVKGWF
jgi:hypothetical protein